MSGRPNESWSAVGRLGLTFGLGAWLGAPGYVAGGVLGTVLFPPAKPEPPDPYTALSLNTAEEGAPVAVHYGVNKIKGNWIYKGALRKKKVEEGGKGGQKTTTGYKYWTWATLGLGRGVLDISRMWKNDDVLVPDGDSSINIYRGTATQTVDPDWFSRAEDVVPLKRVSYIYLNNFYLGENNNTMPTMSTEVHNMPWDSDVDGIAPYVLNKVSEQAVGGQKVLRDKYDRIFTFTNTEMKMYDAKWDLKKTLDLTNLALGSYAGGWDVCFTYSKGKRTNINIAYNDGVDGILYIYTFSSDTGKLETEKEEGVKRGQYEKHLIYDFAPDGITSIQIRSNSQYIFIATDYLSAQKDLIKVALNGQTFLARYDLSAEADIGAILSLGLNEDFVFWCNTTGKTSSIDFNGNVLDTLAPTVDWAPEKILPLMGSTCLMGFQLGNQVSLPDKDYDRVQYAIYDRKTGAFETVTQNELDIDETWWTDNDGSPFLMNSIDGMVSEGANGTIYMTGHDGSGNYYTMELIVDANPAQIIYDLFKEARGFDLTTVDAVMLADVGQVCFENRIGMSFSIVRKQNVGAIIRDVLGHIQAHPFQTNEGKFGFFMPSVNDSLEGTITKDDVLTVKDEGAPDFSIIATSMKDIGLCPNRLNVSYENRLNQYKRDAMFQLDDMVSLELDIELTEQQLNYQMFSNPAVISKMAWKAWKISRFQNKVFTTVLNSRWLKVRHGQVYNLDFPEHEINNQRARIFSIQDAPVETDAGLTVTWMMDDDYIISYEEIDYDASISEDTSVEPPEEVVPIVWEEDARYNNDTYFMGLTAIRNTDGTAYCDIYVSLDAPDNFFYAKRLTQFGNVGDLVNDITKLDKKILVNTDEYEESTFASYTRTNQRNNISYCIIGEVKEDFDITLDNMEFITYREAVALGGDIELRRSVRGKDYTLTKPHLASNDTVVINTGISYNKIEIPSEWIGKTLYFKFVPYNLRGDGIDEDEVDIFEYTIKGWTRKATHTDRLQIYDSTRGELGSRNITSDADVKVVWEYTNRNSGMGEATLSAWEWQGWQAGDVDDYDIIIYQSDGTTVQAEHLGIGLTDEYTYDVATNTADFGGVPSDHFWIGVRPVVTGRGVGREGFEIVKQEVVRI